MRISKSTLERGWAWSTGLGLVVFAVLAAMDLWLKSLTGVSTADLQGLSSAAQFRLAFHAWAPEPYAVRAGFDLGFDYLLMPLYAASFFFSGVLVAERFTPGGSPFRRWVLMAAMVAPVARLARCGRKCAANSPCSSPAPTDAWARIAFSISSAKSVAITVGVVLLIGAVLASSGWERPKPGQKSNPEPGPQKPCVQGLTGKAPFRIVRGSPGTLRFRKIFSFQGFRPCTRSSAPAENSIRWPRTTSSRSESLEGDVGAKLTLGEVLMLGGDTPKLGAPLVKGASVAVRDPRTRPGREGHRLQEEAPQEHPSQARPSPALHQGEGARHHGRLRNKPWHTRKQAVLRATGATRQRQDAWA